MDFLQSLNLLKPMRSSNASERATRILKRGVRSRLCAGPGKLAWCLIAPVTLFGASAIAQDLPSSTQPAPGVTTSPAEPPTVMVPLPLPPVLGKDKEEATGDKKDDDAPEARSLVQ